MAHDAPLEKWLKEHGYTFKFVQDYPLNKLDMAEAAANPARLARKFEDNLAYQYALDYESGADFPAILVLERPGRELDQLGGGTHRVAAAGAARKTAHDAIVVREADPARIDLLLRVANSRGIGMGETEKGKLMHISELRRAYPNRFKIDDLARDFGVKRATILLYLRVSAAEERADRLGVGTFFSAPQRLSSGLKVELNALQSDHVFVAATNLIQSHQQVLRGEMGAELVKGLREAGTERRAFAILSDRDKELTEAQEDRRTKGTKTPSGRLTKYLSHVHSLVRNFPGSAQKLYLAGLGSWRTMKRELKLIRQSQEILSDLGTELEQLIAEAEKAAEWKERAGARKLETT
jgi:hypothetical protein